jgi:Tfp pilus assembly protein PilN
MKALNLLPQDIKLPKTTVRPWVAYAAVGAAALLVAGGMGVLYMKERQHLSDRESTLEDMDAQLATLTARAAQAQAQSTSGSALEGEEQTRATALAFALDGRRGWDRLLRELSLTLPDNVSFRSMTSSTPPPQPALAVEDGSTEPPVQPAPSPTTLTITGWAITQGDVAQLLARMEVVPEFSSIRLESATRTLVQEQYVIEFSVIGELKQPMQVTP